MFIIIKILKFFQCIFVVTTTTSFRYYNNKIMVLVQSWIKISITRFEIRNSKCKIKIEVKVYKLAAKNHKLKIKIGNNKFKIKIKSQVKFW